jgi:hypothetical protein
MLEAHPHDRALPALVRDERGATRVFIPAGLGGADEAHDESLRSAPGSIHPVSSEPGVASTAADAGSPRGRRPRKKTTKKKSTKKK